MNRFEYVDARLHQYESFVCKDNNIKLYDGDEKTQFEDGELVLTTHRLFWGYRGEIAQAARTLCLALSYVISVSEEIASSYVFGRKTRLILYLRPTTPKKLPGPIDNSRAAYIKISGKHGVSVQFIMAIKGTIKARVWEVMSTSDDGTNNQTTSSIASSSSKPRAPTRSGIGGIERTLEAKTRETNDNITLAFQDLNVLMAMAKDMIAISKGISNKIRDRHGNISEDETVRFKSYLLSLGINDPVTRDGFITNTDYFNSLAEQIGSMLLEAIQESGGMMSLADVYCRVNRARGFELLSPEDLLNACKQINGALKLRHFPSGAMLLQLSMQEDEDLAIEILNIIIEVESVAVEELAQKMGISLLLAKERLLSAERLRKVCRDECVSGLRFFPNFFLLPRKSENAVE